MAVVFFFSSRRRHTRWPRDWSSDVCSSDLITRQILPAASSVMYREPSGPTATPTGRCCGPAPFWRQNPSANVSRSEERRVGKEGRGRGARWEQNREKG